jgi:hypothetical protein
MRAGLGLPRFADDLIANSARWKQLGFVAQTLCFIG